MGIFVSASQAAQLVGRHERIVRGWIQSGKLSANKPQESLKWEINTDDLLQASFIDSAHKDNIRRWVETQRESQRLTSNLYGYRDTSREPDYAGADEATIIIPRLVSRLHSMQAQIDNIERDFMAEHEEHLKLKRRIERLEQHAD